MEWTTLTVIITILIAAECNCEIVEAERRWFTIEGRVQAPPSWINQSHLPEWKLATQILINDGQYRAFLKYKKTNISNFTTLNHNQYCKIVKG